MKHFIFFLTVLFFTSAFAVETVSSVDLNRYLGKWYEIASIPAFFQKKCVKNTTAEYKKLDYGKIDVINSCTKKNGKVEVANGIGRIVNTQTNAELKVSFAILATAAPPEELRRRLLARSGDASEATVAVLERQLEWFEALDDDERRRLITS